MKTSEVIKKLQELTAKHGDVDFNIYIYDTGKEVLNSSEDILYDEEDNDIFISFV